MSLVLKNRGRKRKTRENLREKKEAEAKAKWYFPGGGGGGRRDGLQFLFLCSRSSPINYISRRIKGTSDYPTTAAQHSSIYAYFLYKKLSKFLSYTRFLIKIYK